MKPSKDAFLYPSIDITSCVRCGLCERVCESRMTTLDRPMPLATYVFVNRDRHVLESSSSGGVFAALASLVLARDGVVFGCSLNDEMNAEHICIDNLDDLHKLQGSKYVQSSINDAYVKTLDYLRMGREVLFTGTPCQIAGLKAYLGNEYSNLITADIVCHGVPSLAFFKDYIKHLEDKLKGHILDFKFRDKSKGWPGYLAKAIYRKNGTVRKKPIPWFTSYYYDYFLKADILRDSCYECKYAGSGRLGDVTMGDYWGIEAAHPEIDANDGASVFLINSEKGMTLVDELSKMGALKQSTFEAAKIRNSQLIHPAVKTDRRQAILNTWRQEGYEAVANDYFRSHRMQVAMLRLKSFIPESIKTVIKRVIGRPK